MRVAPVVPQEILNRALQAFRQGPAALTGAVDDLPAAFYATDAEGVVTYFNRACVPFAGRAPAAGRDRWCVSWRLYTEQGAFMPHDQCAMALAIRERRPVRGVAAVAERPDGTRVGFLPYPTPVFDEAGDLRGGVNLLLYVTDEEQAESLRAQARKCRRLARSISDTATASALERMAAEYDQKAAVAGAADT